MNTSENADLELLKAGVAELKEQVAEYKKAAGTLIWNNRNWEAVKTSLEVMEQRMVSYDESVTSIKNLVMTLSNQFQQFQAQRAIELQHFVNFGPTVREVVDE